MHFFNTINGKYLLIQIKMNLFPVDKMDGLSCCMNLYSS